MTTDDDAELRKVVALTEIRNAQVEVRKYRNTLAISEKTKREIENSHLRLLIMGGHLRAFLSDSLSVEEQDIFIREALLLAVELQFNPAERMSDTKLYEAAREKFDGAVIVQAYVLTLGYPFHDVFALTPDEVRACYRTAVIAQSQQLSWDTLTQLSSSDIDMDDELLRSFLDSRTYSDDVVARGTR
jgi:hypothetical protein